ncbi:MAG: DUF1016 N-terminal domain-containing protein [Lactobacillales bacterium]|jgi:hypothetical protein|nr:DUF1016 N-terminal domain-containing protein [Lactobacillales bacterium]
MQEIKSNEKEFFENVVSLINDARGHLVKTVNSTMVVTYYEIGRRIVEVEQKGEERGGYGEKLIEKLSEHLTRKFGRGYSVRILKNMRQFYSVYSKNPIRHTVCAELLKLLED